jgi:hypothetical protein
LWLVIGAGEGGQPRWLSRFLSICVAASWRRSRTACPAGQWRSASASPRRRRSSGGSNGGARAPSGRSGDTRSHRLEAHAAQILAPIDEAPGTTLAEIVAPLERQHGRTVAPGSVWRRLDRHGLSGRKNGTRRRVAAA